MKGIRPSALAGAWYDADPAKLRVAVDDHLSKGAPLNEVAKERPVAIIAPHAGHLWSGDAAGCVYRLLQGDAGRTIERVILLGPSHYQGFQGASVPAVAGYQTPLGTVSVDGDVVEFLLTQPHFRTVADAHRQEHCLEIQLPFLQRVLRPSFRIVPILISRLKPSEWREFADALVPHIDANTLVVVSSDFTHYGSRFGYLPFRDDPDGNLRRLDKGALEPILDLDAQSLAAYKEKTDISVCGYRPIGVLIELLQNQALQKTWGGRPEGRVLEYYRSADLLGDFDGSVSYAAIAFFRPGTVLDVPLYPERLENVVPWGSTRKAKKPGGDGEATLRLTKAEEQFLLATARQALVTRLVDQKEPSAPQTFPPDVSAAKLRTTCGVFVTLTHGGRLRGCIGDIVGRSPMIDGVVGNAINAGLRDPRFPPVAASDLDAIHIEISILTPLEQVSGPEAIEVGRHGVLLEREGRRAVFLPQVAPEQGWDRDTMLGHLAAKAGLPRDGWKRKTTFQVFEALVFGEERK